MCHTPKPLALATGFVDEDTYAEGEQNNTKEVKRNPSGNSALPRVPPISPPGLTTSGNFDLTSMEEGSSSTISKSPLEEKPIIRQLSRKQKLAIRRHRWKRRLQLLTPSYDEPTWVWRRAEMRGREGVTSSSSAVVVPGSPGFVAGQQQLIGYVLDGEGFHVPIFVFLLQQTHSNDLCVAPSFRNSVLSSNNEGMDWRETSTFDSISFGTSYADAGSKDRRKQVQVLLGRMAGSRDSGAASLPRPAHEESAEEQVNKAVMTTDELKRRGGAHLESPRMDEQCCLPDGSASSVPFWAKTIWLLDRLAILQGSHGSGKEAMGIEVRRDHLLEDSFNQVGWHSWWCFDNAVFESLLTFATTCYILLFADYVIQSYPPKALVKGFFQG